MNNDDRFNLITSRTILSHSSGLDYFNQGEWPVVFYANPGDEYIYSGIGIYYLQEVIETLTQKPLEALAREYLFGPEGIMKRSTFYPEYQLALASEKEKEYQQPGTLYIKLTDEGLEYEIKRQALITGMVPWAKLPSDFPKQASEIIKNQSKYVSMILDHTASIGATEPAIAANSLRTTAEDYANFLKVWLTDPDLKIAFNPEIYMTHDKWAIDAGVRQEDLEQVAWGLGWGLQTTQQNEAEFIYHSGDMDNWRAWAVINLKAKTAIVYFANSSNGHVLAESIVAPEGKLEPVFNYFYQKYGFSRNIEELQAEGERMSSMGSYLTGSRGKKMTEEVSGKPSTFLPQVEERMRSTVCPRND
jgi:CubicO group peptidase (beta-lactamase class C family)